MSNKEPDVKIVTVEELLYPSAEIKIPNYQRPYKWGIRHTTQLVNDILHHKEKSAYRIGTIVLHESPGGLKIVDGQQRFITLLLIARALSSKSQLPIKIRDITLPNASDISRRNIIENHRHIENLIGRFDESTTRFFLQKCQMVQVTLHELAEAFQFFDSQNSRGKPLEPHDLLKAFHLREMHAASALEKKRVVKIWEAAKTEELSQLFAVYLYRIRRWVNNESARHFNKDAIDMFKGVSLDTCKHPFARTARIVHLYVNQYNQSMHRDVHQEMPYPFQLDQPIINGQRFFEMIAHYLELFAKIKDTHDLSDEIEHYQKMHKQVKDGEIDKDLKQKKQSSILEEWNLDSDALKIIHALATYGGRYRSGDAYTRVLFDCCLAFYVDKFGLHDISRAIRTSFEWAYTLRVSKIRVAMASMDNHARAAAGVGNVFKKIKDITHPHDFVHMSVPQIKEEDIRAGRVDEIKDLLLPKNR